LSAYDNFDDRYLGTKTSDPTLDNDGNALVAGALYFNSVSGAMKVYTGSAWVAAYVSGTGFLSTSNNLSELTATASTARTNLGLGAADSPQFTALNVGNASDTTVTRASAGVIAVEGNAVLTANNIGTSVQAYSAELQGASQGGIYSFKNRIINGAMVIDQRNAGASVTATSTSSFAYTVDRFSYRATAASKFTVQQNAGSVTPPAGFINYLGVTSSSAYSVSASDFFSISQLIEGLNVADLAWGTANAVTVTLSFKVYSSLTGTFGGSIANNVFGRSYPFSYTISSANTWTSISVTIPGDTSGTWLTTNGIGMLVNFGLGVGSTNSGTAGAWAGAQYFAPTGATSVVGTNGATFYITGVQLEKGSTATSFDYRDYGRELMLCQRYYCKTFDIGTAPGNNVSGVGELLGLNILSGTYEPGQSWRFPVAMRAAPTVTMYNPGAGTAGQWYDGANSSANARAFNPGTSGVWFDNSGTGLGGARYRIQAVAAIEL
jgi:hypothetical protein